MSCKRNVNSSVQFCSFSSIKPDDKILCGNNKAWQGVLITVEIKFAEYGNKYVHEW